MKLDSGRIYIRRLEMDDLSAPLDLRMQNRYFLRSVTANSHYTIVAQMENDFKEFQALLFKQIASIKAEPDATYEQRDPSAINQEG